MCHPPAARQARRHKNLRIPGGARSPMNAAEMDRLHRPPHPVGETVAQWTRAYSERLIAVQVAGHAGAFAAGGDVSRHAAHDAEAPSAFRVHTPGTSPAWRGGRTRSGGTDRCASLSFVSTSRAI